MARIVLTDLGIRALKTKSNERIEIWDSRQPGFGVRVSPNGAKTFVLMYRHAGRKHRATLGKFPALSLAEARMQALSIQAKLEKGEPPHDQPAVRDQRLFPEVVDEFVAKYCAIQNRSTTAYETERILRSRFVPAWRTREVRTIARADVIAILDDTIASGKLSAANHALSAVRKLLSWCVERSIVDSNPCHGISRPSPIVERDRALDDDELGRVWHGASRHGGPFGTIVQVLILTAQRRGEVAGMRWSELDMERRVWTLPSDRTKNKRTHVVPLTARVIGLIDTMPRTNVSGSPFVFPARGNPNAPMSGFSKLAPKLAASIDVAPWTLHDLRRTGATGMARLGVAPHIVERVLNHASGTLGGVAGIYNRFNYAAEMRIALEAWEQHIDGLLK